MKTTIKDLQDSFESWYAVNEQSRKEVATVLDMYHNRQWAPEQVLELEHRGQPKETFNIIKSLTRTLIGYYASVVNKAVIEPTSYNDITKATLLNDIMANAYENTDFELVDDDIKLYGFLTGIFASHTTVRTNGQQDMFGRNEQELIIADENVESLVLDPLSKRRDYKDARGIHSFKWVDGKYLRKEFGKNQSTIDKLDAYANHLSVDEAEFTYKYDNEFIGKYKVDNMYLLVHSIMGDESTYWCGTVELSRTKIKYEPYTITKVIKSNKEEYYGIFHEVIEPQKAINQALIQIQLLVNSNKVFVEDGAVADVDEFADVVSRVNSVAVVEDLKGIDIKNMSQNVADQYTILDNAYTRIKQVLGINDAMLGEAYAADSGRKVKLQKNTGAMTLRYLTGPLELFHKNQAKLMAELISEHYTAHQILRVADDITGNRFIEINKPLLMPKLPPELQQLVAQGMPIGYAFEAMLTGQLSPKVQEAMQMDQQLQQANQAYQQEQQQAMAMTMQREQMMVSQGLSPQNMAPIPTTTPAPPPANNVATLQDPDLSKQLEGSKKSMRNKAMSNKSNLPNAPEGLMYMYDEIINPETGVPETDKNGSVLLIPKAQPDSMIDIKSFEVSIQPSKFDDEDEKAQLMMELLLNGPAGQFAQNASPAHYAKMVSLNVQSMKTKHSPEIAQMFNEMAMAMGQNPEFQAYMRQVATDTVPQQQAAPGDDGNGGMLPGGQQGGGPQSSALKLPQNTNEGY